MKRLFSCLWMTAAVLALTVFCTAQFTGITRGPTYILRYGDNQPDDYPTTQGGKYFAELVYERTHGDVRVYVYPDEALGEEGDVIRQIQFGGIDMARVSTAQLIEHSDRFAVLTLPYLYRDTEHLWNVLDGPIGDSFLGPIGESGLVGLSWYDAGARSFYTTKPIRTLDDLSGLTVRVQEAAYMEDMIRALGASPKALPYSMVYSNLSAGTVDGAENNWPSYVASQHYKVARYFLLDEHVRIPEMQIISQKTIDALPEEYVQIIQDCAKESALYERELWQQREAEAMQTAVENGTVITRLSEDEKQRFQTACQPLYQKYASDYLYLVQRILDTE